MTEPFVLRSLFSKEEIRELTRRSDLAGFWAVGGWHRRDHHRHRFERRDGSEVRHHASIHFHRQRRHLDHGNGAARRRGGTDST